MASETPNDPNEQKAPETAEPEAQQASQYSPDELQNKPAPATAGGADVNLDLVLDVPVNISLRVGSTEISIRDLVKLVEGSVIALDKESTEPMDLLVNGILIAHGEIVVVDEKFGVRLTDVVSPVERIETLN
jgi:flagellar motor switch protein FliN/FliY